MSNKLPLKERLKKNILEAKDDAGVWLKSVTTVSFWKWYACYLLFGLGLVVIFALFKNNPALLHLDFKAPHIWAFFTASFFHGSWQHLFSNLFVYLALITINGIILYRAGLTKAFNKAFLWIIFALPFITTISNYLLFAPQMKPLSGSSDIVAALIGLTFSTLLVLVDRNKRIVFSTLLVFYTLPLLAVLKFNLNFTWALVLCFFPMYLYILIKKKPKMSDGFVIILTVLAIAYSSVAIFPTEIIEDAPLINTWSHFVGLVYGLIVGYFTIRRQA